MLLQGVDLNKKQLILTTIFQYMLVAGLSLILFALVTHAWNLNIGIPFYYSWDSVFSGFFIKSVIDTGWYTHNSFVGAPEGYNLLDYPLADSMHFFAIKMLSFFIHHYAVIWNIFYILTFPLIAVTALFVFRQLGLNYLFAVVASLLFSLHPYHFFRGAEGHLFLASYYVVPLIVWIAVVVGTNQMAVLRTKSNYLSWCFYLFLAFLIGSSGIYYAIFSIFFLLCAGLITSVKNKNIFSLMQVVILCGLISTVVVVNLLPTLRYRMHYGVNEEVAVRTPFEAELYGLRITQMLLPLDGDRLAKGARLKSLYNRSAPNAMAESRYASLGMLGSIGFIILLFIVLLRLNVRKELEILSQLNLCAVLLATVGGFGSLFAYTLSPMVRCYNRISIFIAFFSLYAFCYLAQCLWQKYAIFNKKILSLFFLGILLSVGVYTQTNASFTTLQMQARAKFDNDEKFVKEIENKLERNGMVYQLPYVPFPEHSPPVAMVDYEHMRPYLHSHFLKWSYGAMKGRPVASWQQRLNDMPVLQMVNNLSYAGFHGIYVDRNGYIDRGAEMEKQLERILHTKPIVSGDNNFSFFDMRQYADRLRKVEFPLIWNQHLAQLQAQFKVTIGWSKGFYGLEQEQATKWHWGSQRGLLNVINYSSQVLHLKISFKALTNDSALSSLTIKSALLNKTLQINNQGTVFSTILLVPPGMHKLTFYSDGQQVEAPGDARQLFFRIEDFNWEVVS